MRTTLNLDDQLLARAHQLSGVKERSSLMREALEALVQRESALRLARLGGSQPALKVAARRRAASKAALPATKRASRTRA
jgi:Arc/MetJ family transcription regulator